MRIVETDLSLDTKLDALACATDAISIDDLSNILWTMCDCGDTDGANNFVDLAFETIFHPENMEEFTQILHDSGNFNDEDIADFTRYIHDIDASD